MQKVKIQESRARIRVLAKLDFSLIPVRGHNPQPCQSLKRVKDIKRFYQISEKVGQGSSGVVKKCTEIKTGKTLAIKIIGFCSQQLITIVKQTFANQSRLKHPSITKAHALYIDQKVETIYYLSELVQFQSLQQHLSQRQQLNQRESKFLCWKILEAVDYMHSKGICHRDLKPQNIMVDFQNLLIKIIDFGISKSFIRREGHSHSSQAMWTVTGTLQYKAPQIYKGGGYTQLVDQWAVGVILFRMLAGRLPFYQQYKLETIQSILNNEPSFDQVMPPLAVNIIRRLLKKQSSQRISAEVAMQHPWFAQLHKEDVMRSVVNIPNRDYHMQKSQTNIHKQTKLQELKQQPHVIVMADEREDQLWLNNLKLKRIQSDEG